MKSLSRILVFTIFVFTILSACQTKKEDQKRTIGVYNTEGCLLSKISFAYPNMDIDLNFVYSKDNQLNEINRMTNDYVDRSTKFAYNDKLELEKISVYYGDTLALYETIAWNNGRAIVSLFNLENGDWVNKNKVSLTFNDFSEIIALDDFYVDTNNVWSRKGTLYDYGWENGNLSAIKNYVVDEQKDVEIDLSKKNRYFIASIEGKEYMVDNYTELHDYYVTTFEYSDILNPFHQISIAPFISPNNYNCSRMLQNSMKKEYKSGEVITKEFTITETKNNYPLKGIIKANVLSDGQTSSVEYKISFEYVNCK